MERAATRSGEAVILLLFLVLALSVIAVFTTFALFIEDPEVRGKVWPIILRNLYLPVMGTSVLVAIDAWRRKRSGWWVYLVTAPMPGINVALAIAWLVRWRRTPKPFLRWSL